MDGCVNFYRKLIQYKAGLRYMDGEYFLGLDKIQTISNDQPQELWLLVEDFEEVVRYETYN